MKGLFGRDRVCGVVAAGTSREMILQIRLGLRTTRTLELRLDYLRGAKERDAFLSWLGRIAPRAVLIATCRRQEGGGLFQGSREEQIEILAQRARCRVRLVRCGDRNGQAHGARRARVTFSRAGDGVAPRFPQNAAKSRGHRSPAGARGRASHKDRGALPVRFRQRAHLRIGAAAAQCRGHSHGRIRAGRARAVAAHGQRSGICGSGAGHGARTAFSGCDGRSIPRPANYPPHSRVWSDRQSDRAFALAASAQHGISRAQIRRGICSVSRAKFAGISWPQ